MAIENKIERFYLYKLWVVGHKEFYIGVTNNPERRMSQHFSYIYCLLRPLKYNKKVKASQPAYITFAKNLLKGKSILQINTSLKSRIRFRVIKEAVTHQEINVMETEALAKFAPNPLCLNIETSSRYVRRMSMNKLANKAI